MVARFGRIGLLLALVLLGARAWGFTVGAGFLEQSAFKVESSGTQTVVVTLEREFDQSGLPIDPAGICQIRAVVRIGSFTAPPNGTEATPGVDYTAIDAQPVNLTISSGEPVTTATFDVPVIDDQLDEPNELFAAQVVEVTPLECPSGAQFSLLPEQPVPIVDDDLPTTDGTVSFANLPLTVAENVGTAVVVVNRIDGGQGALSYDLFLEGITATPGEDFVLVGGTLDWVDGETSPKTLEIPIPADAVLEGDERFDVYLSSTTNPDVVIGGSVTIRDEPAVLQFEVVDVRVHENVQVAELAVTRTGSTFGDVSVVYFTEATGTATPGVDYESTGGTLSWGDGDSSPRPIFVTIIPGQIPPTGDTFSLRLAQPLGANAVVGANDVATVTIEPFDPGQLVVRNTPLTVAENASPDVFTVEVERVGSADGDLVVDYLFDTQASSAVAGQDYNAVEGALEWRDGETGVRSFEITVIDDQLDEPDRSLVIGFVPNAPGMEAFSETLTITDDETSSVVEFAVTALSVREDAGLVEATVTRTGSAAGAATVQYQTASGTATAGEDFTDSPGLLEWADGETGARTIQVPIIAGAIDPGGEVFTIELVEASGSVTLGPASAVAVTIEPLVPGEVAFGGVTPYSVAENAGVAVISVDRINGSGGVLTIPYFTSPLTAVPGADYSAVTGTLQWADGDTAPKTFEVPIIDDQTADGDRLLRVGLSLGQEAIVEEDLRIVDDDQPSGIGFTVTDLEVDEDGGTLVATVARQGGSPGGVVTVDFATADGTAVAGEDFTAASGTLTWNDGDIADKQIQIEILAGAIDGAAETFTVTLSNVTGPATLGSASVATVAIAALSAQRDISGIDSLTPNQRALATWFDATCPRLEDSEGLTADQQDLRDICGVIRSVDLGDDDLKDALDAINPEELFAAGTSALRLTVAQHGNLSQRLNALRNGARGVDLSGLNLEIDGQLVAGEALQAFVDGLIGGGASADEPTWGRWGAFLNGRISTGDKDETVNEAGFDYDLQGITLGVDYRIRDNFIVGVGGGLGAVESDYFAKAGGLDIDSWNASAFLTYFREETFYADAMVTYGENDYDSTRNILFDAGALGVVDRTARGTTDGTQFSAGVGLGWDFSHGAWTYGPHAGFYHYRVEVDGFAETGAAGLDLAIGDQEVTSLTGNAGGHVSYAVLTDWGVLVPNARIDWVREFEDGAESLTYGFVNDPFVADPQDPSPKITLRSDRPDTSYFIMAAGVSAQFIQGISGFVNYQTYSGYGDFTISEWNFGLRWEKTY